MREINSDLELGIGGGGGDDGHFKLHGHPRIIATWLPKRGVRGEV